VCYHNCRANCIFASRQMLRKLSMTLASEANFSN
jgi:hypothetical protein